MKTRKDILRPIRSLVRNQCATFYDGNKCHLSPGDQPFCSFFREDGLYPEHLKNGKVRCSYFETHVLPADPKLEAHYWGRHPMEGQQKSATCDRCGKEYARSNNRQLYCSDCRTIIARDNARERQRRKRIEKWNPRVTL